MVQKRFIDVVQQNVEHFLDLLLTDCQAAVAGVSDEELASLLAESYGARQHRATLVKTTEVLEQAVRDIATL